MHCDKSPSSGRRGAAIAWVVVAYAVALGAALAAGWALSGQHPLIVAAVADVAGTLVILGFSVTFSNSSFYDPYWSVAPLPLALYFATLAPAEGSLPRQALWVGLIALWGARLTWNWLRGWSGLDHEDWRYVDLRAKHGRVYWLVSAFGIHLLPTALVFGGLLPVWRALSMSGRPFGAFDLAAGAVTLLAIVIEAQADQQLYRYRQRADRDPTEVFAEGLWAYSRHPNYFGELLFWWGLFLGGLAAHPTGNWWTGLGAASLTGLFLWISIPMIDRRMLARRPAYAERMKRVSRLIPRFPK